MNANTSTKLTLYHLPTCLYCLKVRGFLLLKNIKLPTANIVNPRSLQELTSGGGKRQVPCLRIEKADGSSQWLYESSDIIRFIKSNSVQA